MRRWAPEYVSLEWGEDFAAGQKKNAVMIAERFQIDVS